MPVKVGWPQALAWRMRRHLLDPVGELSAPDVVRRLCGVQAQVASSAELAIRVRQQASQPGEVAEALATGRSWEVPSWQRYFGMTPRHWELFRPAVRQAIDGSVLTREQLATAITATPGLEHVGEALAS